MQRNTTARLALRRSIFGEHLQCRLQDVSLLLHFLSPPLSPRYSERGSIVLLYTRPCGLA